jgi:hypothetical protein
LWDEKELIGELDNYLDNLTEEQMLKDLEDTGSLHLVEDVES